MEKNNQVGGDNMTALFPNPGYKGTARYVSKSRVLARLLV